MGTLVFKTITRNDEVILGMLKVRNIRSKLSIHTLDSNQLHHLSRLLEFSELPFSHV